MYSFLSRFMCSCFILYELYKRSRSSTRLVKCRQKRKQMSELIHTVSQAKRERYLIVQLEPEETHYQTSSSGNPTFQAHNKISSSSNNNNNRVTDLFT